ncbi:potassium channel protein [Deferribacterales bacterium Es71-Z0220]|uniref:potassium channel family protein n=1 Tax=Deferrivibrio essentukiensis TaxID=2880922 RepID=UPI001F601E5F|nr:potassium channel protein [Deferrivibrio essentukiensis]MCB4204155.1 potassium channel protein [Deferrivibrio essentukiensis]
MNPLRKIVISFLIIVSILAIGTIGYEYIEGVSFLDSFYMTVITITTVGFSEVFPLSTTGKYFTIFIILTGAGTIAFAATQAIEIVVAGEIRKILGRRKMDKKKVPFVVIDKDNSKIDYFNEKGIIYIIGDATKESVLMEANILEAKGLIAVVSSDAENVYIVLTAKGFSKNLFVIARSSDEESATKMFWAGADKVFSPYTIGAVSIANTILKPNVTEFMDIVMGKNNFNIEVGEIALKSSSKLIGKKIRESNIRKIGIIVVAIKKKTMDFIYNPGPDTVFEEGDTIIVLGQSNIIEQLENLI